MSNLISIIQNDLKGVLTFITKSKSLLNELSPTALTIVIAILDSAIKDTADIGQMITSDGLNLSADTNVLADIETAVAQIKAFIASARALLTN